MMAGPTDITPTAGLSSHFEVNPTVEVGICNVCMV